MLHLPRWVRGTFSACLYAISLHSFSSHLRSEYQVPPDHAEVEGKVVALTTNGDNVLATLQITKVVSYGAGFTVAISPNDTLEAELAVDAESIAVNDNFLGQIKQRLSELNSSGNQSYTLNRYLKHN